MTEEIEGKVSLWEDSKLDGSDDLRQAAIFRKIAPWLDSLSPMETATAAYRLRAMIPEQNREEKV